jgi:hypothetical protein
VKAVQGRSATGFEIRLVPHGGTIVPAGARCKRQGLNQFPFATRNSR